MSEEFTKELLREMAKSEAPNAWERCAAFALKQWERAEKAEEQWSEDVKVWAKRMKRLDADLADSMDTVDRMDKTFDKMRAEQLAARKVVEAARTMHREWCKGDDVARPINALRAALREYDTVRPAADDKAVGK